MKAFALLISLICIFPAICRSLTLHVPADYPTIQAGIDDAVDGDTVLVADGTYTGEGNVDLNTLGKAIHLVSENGPELCIIDGESDHRLLSCISAEEHTTIIEGIHFTGGTNSAILLSSSPWIKNCRVSLCDDTAFYCTTSHARLTNCSFSENTAQYAEPYFVHRPIHLADASLFIENCLFDANTYQGDGGAMYCGSSEYQNPDPTVLQHCQFTNNSSEMTGGAITFYGDALLENCTFSGNAAENGGGALAGGSATILNCIFRENSTIWSGGAVLGSFHDISGCLFEYNSADNGGAISIRDNQATEIDSTIFRYNFAESGGAIHSSGGHPNIKNSVFHDNGYPYCIGGAVYIEKYDRMPEETPLYFRNNVFYNNEAQDGALVFGDLNWSPITVTNCIFQGSTPAQIVNAYDTELYIQHCLVQGGFPGYGNIDGDPQFTAPYDFHLSGTSPCIDAGMKTHDCENDFFGGTRPRGLTYDIGIHEYEGWPDESRLYLQMPKHYYAAGDTCSCTVVFWNASDTVLTDRPLFVILDVFGALYFAPDFSDFNFYDETFSPGRTDTVILDAFTWPEDTGSADGIFWLAALTDAEISRLESNLTVWEFGWGR